MKVAILILIFDWGMSSQVVPANQCEALAAEAIKWGHANSNYTKVTCFYGDSHD